MDVKHIFGFIGTGFTVVGFGPYFFALWKKTAKPHAFSWILWSLINAIVCAAQVSQDAGAGAWVVGFCCVLNGVIGLWALKHGEKNVTRSDWAIFVTVLLVIPLWMALKDPLWSVVILAVIDTAALAPTFRKSWIRPREEVVLTPFMVGIGFVFSLASIENYIFTNYFFSAVVIVVNACFVSMLLLRRRAEAVA